MPHIQAFHGLRYDLGHVGALSEVVAPPYDVIDADLQDELYKRHPANVVRLILNREEPGDDDADNKYTRAGRFLKNWRGEGVLLQEHAAAVYVYHQHFQIDGREFTRRGFMCRVRLERFGDGNIYPHEETHSGPKADRLKLTTACRANLSQIFGLFPDEDNAAQDLLETQTDGVAPLEATDHLGVVHRIWPVTDVSVISQLEGVMGPKPVFIADGHHRYETACNYRDALAEQHGGSLPAEHPANYVLMMCVGMSDPGMVVLPTHRLFRGAPEITAEQLHDRLGGCFTCRLAGEGADLAEMIWDQIEAEDEQGAIGLFTQRDQRWTMARITEAGRAQMAEIAPDQSGDWQGLGVAILHRLVIDSLLGLTDLPSPKYVRSIDEVAGGLSDGDDVGRDATGQLASGGQFNLGAVVMPATLEHIRAISEHNERMPAKSTYFYPKLLSGLVINPLD